MERYNLEVFCPHCEEGGKGILLNPPIGHGSYTEICHHCDTEFTVPADKEYYHGLRTQI